MQSRIALTLLAFLAPPIPLATAVLPQYDGYRHTGVNTCAGAPCHGKTSEGQQAVLQTEHRTWIKHDPHAQAYQVLFNRRSKRIQENLDMKQAPHQSDLCLDCHADNVAAGRRGPKFSLEEGVGCEACHGGSERWLKPHDAGRPHATNVAQGMYPTDDPVARAELCVSCHYGNARKFVGHKLMGAGHPRMSFELAVFSQTQPPHFRVDADYRSRGKTAAPGVKIWAIGQAVAVQQMLEALLDPERARFGIWPELALFDCDACHHRMSEVRWKPRPSTGLGPGLPRLDDSSFLMLRHAISDLDADEGEAFRKDLRALHAATSTGEGDAKASAKRLNDQITRIIPRLAAWKAGASSVRSVLDSIIQEGIDGEYLDYSAAEQASMAIQALVDNLFGLGALDGSKVTGVVKECHSLVDAVQDHENYERARVVGSFTRLRDLLAPRSSARPARSGPDWP